MAGLQRTRGCASHQTEVWRIAPAREGPRNESNNNAHKPTSGRSTHYGSEHLIRVFRDIGHIFSSLRPFIGGSVFLVALAAVPDLLFSAKYLFGAANSVRSAMGVPWGGGRCLGKGWGEKRLKTFPDGRFTGGFAPPMAVVALGTRPTPFIALNRLVGVA